MNKKLKEEKDGFPRLYARPLTKEEQENLVKCLKDTSGPTKRMKELMSLPDFKIKEEPKTNNS